MSNGSSSCPQVILPFGLFADSPTIAPLDPADFPAADPPPLLEQFIEDNAPDDATPADGFDDVFNETVAIVDSLDSALANLENDLLVAFAEADLIDAAPVGAIVDGFGASLGPSDSAVGNLGLLLSGAAPPTPPGGGGGGGGGGSSPCAVQDFGNVQEGTQKTITIQITNNGNAAVTIKKMQVAGNNGPNIFDFSPKYTDRKIQPGVSIPLSIYALAQNAQPQAGGYSSTLTVFTDQPDPQPCLLLKANVTAGTPAPGGGGGGSDGNGGGCDVGFDPQGRLHCLD
jgi:hypothetical protein